MGLIVAARGTLYMLSVCPHEQQVAEKPYREHLTVYSTSYHIPRIPFKTLCPFSVSISPSDLNANCSKIYRCN